MNITKVLTRDYGNNSNWTLGENEPKTNPIKPNSCPPSVWRIKGKKILMRLTINNRIKPCASPTTGPWRNPEAALNYLITNTFCCKMVSNENVIQIHSISQFRLILERGQQCVNTA
ncbi:MAG: hypothetical protein FVQ85_07850 [Planctomycetes bacterium]|nr:hypothetical protein [Planctomycetota bacterium]